MKTTFLLFFFLLFFIETNAQQLVWDISAVETLISNHSAQYSAFTKMKDNEGKISALQQSIASKMTQVEFFATKFHNSLKSVSAILSVGKDIVYASDIANDIGKYQKQMIVLASGDPKLSVVAAKAELQLISRTADMMNYIYQTAVVGTDVNLMDSKQRLDLLKHVIDELRSMRGLAYSICRQMKAAKRNGVLQTLAPGTFKYKENSAALVKQTLDEFQVNPKK